jgi:hypothetical protein
MPRAFATSGIVSPLSLSRWISETGTWRGSLPRAAVRDTGLLKVSDHRPRRYMEYRRHPGDRVSRFVQPCCFADINRQILAATSPGVYGVLTRALQCRSIVQVGGALYRAVVAWLARSVTTRASHDWSEGHGASAGRICTGAPGCTVPSIVRVPDTAGVHAVDECSNCG